jgi:predicted thioesterase
MYRYEKTITKSDIAAFESGVVHEVYSTFAAARDAEWACRLHVLAVKTNDEEEGIGTFINIKHHAPAFVGELITYTSEYDKTLNGELICNFEGKVGERLIVKGCTGQRILLKSKIDSIFNAIKSS